VVALDKEHLFFDRPDMVAHASLMLLNNPFEAVQFVLVSPLLGVPFETKTKGTTRQQQGR
jgi:hypothetical protein